jgi:Mg/Co/Ni transporter MgtE
VDADQHLLGVVAFRDLLYAERSERLDDIMIRAPFALRPTMSLVAAMRDVVTRHYPVYPVCEEDGRLVGQVRGQILFEQQAFEISAQAGALAGVAMYIVVARGGGGDALMLGLITMAAMAISCMLAGLCGSLIPIVLKRLGADPATASSIFLTTITDVVSMGSFLGLVTWLVL